MTLPLTRFDRDTAVRRVDASTFEGEIDKGWWIIRGPNGGYIAAILLRAFRDVVADPERAPRSISVHFTAPPEAGPVRIDAATERTGGSLTTVSGRMWQGDRLCATAVAAFSKPRSAPEFQDVSMPAVPGPEAAEPLGGVGIPIRDRYEQRAVVCEAGPADGLWASGGWIRLREPQIADAIVMAAFADAWPPSIWQRTGGPILYGVPTIDLTVHFRRTLPLEPTDPGDFHLALFHSRNASEGFVEEDGLIWSPAGVLLAQSRQLGVLVPRA